MINIKEFLEGVVGVVEANSFESMCLYKDYKDSWEEATGGPLVTVGEMDTDGIRYPVCVSLLVRIVKGRKILFIEPTSIVVNWNMIEKWLFENLPETALNTSGFVNKTNAMNFHNLLRD